MREEIMLRWLAHAYAAATRAYPRTFRDRFGEEMGEAFRDHCRRRLREGGRLALAASGIWGVVEATWSGLAERIGNTEQDRNPMANRRRVMRARTERFIQALHHAGRRLIKTPTFAIVTVLSVGFGVGAFASILSVVDGALLERLPYRDSNRLIWIWRNYTWFDFPRGWLGGPDIAWLREQTQVFEEVVALDADEANLTDADGGAPEETRVMMATDEFFDVLGVSPMMGRGFAAGESDSAAAGVVVLGFDLWQRRYGGDKGIVGREILLDGQPQRVIGVMPRDFRFVMHASLGDPVPADLYATLQGDLARMSPNAGRLGGLARVRPGAEARVQPALDGVAKRLDTEAFRGRGLKLWSIGMREDLTASVRPALTALFGAGAFLLLALAANLATLQMARAADRSREVAVRSALGAGRVGSVLDLMAESLLITLTGGAIGLLLAPRVLDALLIMAPPSLPRIEAMGVDASVASITVIVCIVLGFVAALGPAWRLAKRPIWIGLRAGGPRAGGSAEASRARATLVMLQVSLTLVLLVGAGLLARSVAALLRVDPGFNKENVLTFRVPLDFTRYPENERIRSFHATLRDRLEAMPGVVSAGAVNAIPLAASTNQTGVAFPGAPGNTGDREQDEPLIDWFTVSPGYFETMQISMLEGRDFDERDTPDGALGIIIDETLARRFFPGTSAVGHTSRFNDTTVTILGVVRHARFYNVFSDDRGQVYLPATQVPFLAMYYTIRTLGDPMAMLPAARTVVGNQDSSVPVANAQTLATVVRASLGQQRLSLWLLAGFAFGALVLATMGIYGVVANSVVRRTREFGVRLALGAERRNVLRLVLAEGSLMIVVGLALGVGSALLVTRVLGSLLFGLAPWDPLTFASATLGLGAVAGIACIIPGVRATRIPPAEALRTD